MGDGVTAFVGRDAQAGVTNYALHSFAGSDQPRVQFFGRVVATGAIDPLDDDGSVEAVPLQFAKGRGEVHGAFAGMNRHRGKPTAPWLKCPGAAARGTQPFELAERAINSRPRACHAGPPPR